MRIRLAASVATALLAAAPAGAASFNAPVPVPIPPSYLALDAPFFSNNNLLSPVFGTTSNTFAQGNDSRIVGAAPLASPAFTGAPTAPTPATSDNSTDIATTAFVGAFIPAGGYLTANQTIAVSGDCSGSGATAISLICTKTNGVAFGALATVTPGTGIATLLGGAASGTGGPAGTASPTFTGTPLFASSALCSAPSIADATGSTTGWSISGSSSITQCIGGTGYWIFNTNGLVDLLSTSGLYLPAAAPTGTSPNVIPNRSKTDAGIGAVAAGDVSIATDVSGSGAENLRLSAKYMMQVGNYAVSTLPTCGSSLKGAQAIVTDAASPSYLGSLTGGSSTVVRALCNGSAWVAD